jgi:predicted ATPase
LKGLTALREAEQLAAVTQESWWTAELHRLRGELLLRQGAPLAVVASCFDQSIKLARQQSAKLLELRATVSLARLWQQQGKQGEAQQRLTELLNSFTEGWDTPDLQDAQTLLSHLRIALDKSGV